MDDQTAIDVHECGKYSEDRRDHHEGDRDTPEEMPIERHVVDPNPRRRSLHSDRRARGLQQRTRMMKSSAGVLADAVRTEAT